MELTSPRPKVGPDSQEEEKATTEDAAAAPEPPPQKVLDEQLFAANFVQATLPVVREGDKTIRVRDMKKYLKALGVPYGLCGFSKLGKYVASAKKTYKADGECIPVAEVTRVLTRNGKLKDEEEGLASIVEVRALCCADLSWSLSNGVDFVPVRNCSRLASGGGWT